MIKSIGSSAIYVSSNGTASPLYFEEDVETAPEIRNHFFEAPPVALPDFDFPPSKIYVLKYDHRRIGVGTLQRILDELRKVVELKKCSVIAIPDTTDISEFSLDELTKLRDELTETIKNMSYDNIIGF